MYIPVVFFLSFLGTFMHLEGSPTLDKTAAIEFTVNTSRTAYRFWYFILNGVSNTVNQIRLFTAVDDDDDDEDDDNKELLSTTITNAWVMSPCYHLSSPFSGTIEIHAEIDAGEKRVLAIDNLQLVDKENCTGNYIYVPGIERLGAYVFQFSVHLSVCSTVCLHKLNMKTFSQYS